MLGKYINHPHASLGTRQLWSVDFMRFENRLVRFDAPTENESGLNTSARASRKYFRSAMIPIQPNFGAPNKITRHASPEPFCANNACAVEGGG